MIWESIVAHVRRHHPDRARHWFGDLEVIDLNQGVLRVRVDDEVQLRYLKSECRGLFNEAVQQVTQHFVTVQFEGPGGQTAVETPPAAPHSPAAVQYSTGDPSLGTMYEDMVINPDYTFDTFVVGPHNQLGHAAAVAICDDPGRSFNPLFVHGGVGLGKTHLLQAVCREILNRHRGFRIYYLSCEGFRSQYLEAVQNNAVNEFRHRFRTIDMLVMDDIHFLSRHDRSQEEFFHTFNSLYHARKQVVLSSDASPEEIPDIEERLKSRFTSGLVARIGPASFETRKEILELKAKMRGLMLPSEVVEYLAQRECNIRDLEASLTQVQGEAMSSGQEISIEVARRAVAATRSGNAPAPRLTMEDITQAVCEHFGVKASDLVSDSRYQSITLPRQVVMYLARLHTRQSLKEIGGKLGGRDHTTVIHAEKKVKSLCDEETGFMAQIHELERRLGVRTD